MEELNKYVRMLNANRTPFKTKREIDEKVAELKKCKVHSYTNEEVSRMVAANKEQGLAKGNLAQRRIEMQARPPPPPSSLPAAASRSG